MPHGSSPDFSRNFYAIGLLGISLEAFFSSAERTATQMDLNMQRMFWPWQTKRHTWLCRSSFFQTFLCVLPWALLINKEEERKWIHGKRFYQARTMSLFSSVSLTPSKPSSKASPPSWSSNVGSAASRSSHVGCAAKLKEERRKSVNPGLACYQLTTNADIKDLTDISLGTFWDRTQLTRLHWCPLGTPSFACFVRTSENLQRGDKQAWSGPWDKQAWSGPWTQTQKQQTTVILEILVS